MRLANWHLQGPALAAWVFLCLHRIASSQHSVSPWEAHCGLKPRRGDSSGFVPCALLANRWESDPTSGGTLV